MNSFVVYIVKYINLKIYIQKFKLIDIQSVLITITRIKSVFYTELLILLMYISLKNSSLIGPISV